jgi:hypothetical protein
MKEVLFKPQLFCRKRKPKVWRFLLLRKLRIAKIDLCELSQIDQSLNAGGNILTQSQV